MIRAIHYTKEETFQLKPIKIENDNFVKPKGGIWVSPIKEDNSNGWKEWCEEENFAGLNKYQVIFNIDLKDVIIIDSYDDLKKLKWKKIHPEVSYSYPDFEKIKGCGVCGIYLTERGQWETRLSRPLNLYGWDCESILIINERCIISYEQITN